jgi:DNA polymerase III epsilon subunit family exonuclease
LNNKHYVIVDIETTGLSKNRHHITEIAAVQFDGKNIINTFQTLINPQTPIPAFITKLTGINNEMVKDAPTIKQALPDFFDFLGDNIFVAHNATFDYGFLNYNRIKHFDVPIKNHTLCTRRLANRIIPQLPNKRLESLCQHFGVTNQRAHRAMGDVMATVNIFEQFLHILKKR